MTNSFCFSVSDVNLMNLTKPVRMDAIVEPPIEYLVPDWVCEVNKNCVYHLPTCQITQYNLSSIGFELEADFCQKAFGSVILI